MLTKQTIYIYPTPHIYIEKQGKSKRVTYF